MSIKQFQQELSKGLPSPVYLLSSSEDFLLYEALSAIKEQSGEAVGFNFDTYDIKSPDDTLPLSRIIDILNTMPFLSERRTVVIQNIQKLAKKEVQKLDEYLLNPADTALLVMLHSGATPKLFDAPALKKVKAIALTVQEREIPLWIQSQARQKHITLTDRAVEYLIMAAGTDLCMLAAEVEKLACLANNDAIDVADLRSIIYSGAEYSAFDLLDALKRNDAKEVFRIYESVSKDQEPQMLLGALNYYYGRQQSSGTIKLLHEADVAIKTSHRYVIEDLLVKLLLKNHRGE